MLRSLLIKNYALLSDIQIEFGPGLNILTGETGAGKSIIIGALGTILGDRVDTSMIGTDGAKAIVEGEFSAVYSPDLHEFLLHEELASPDDTLIVRREILDSGRSRAFVNDSPVQLSTLQRISDFLVELHGQHEHQSLLKSQNHLGYLDGYGGLSEEVEQVTAAYEQLIDYKKRLKTLVEKRSSLQEQRDLLNFQMEEIDKINPGAEEEEELLRESKIVQNSERLHHLSNALFKDLYEDEDSAYDLVSRALQGMRELEGIDKSFAKVREDCEQARVVLEEAAKFLEAYKSGLDFSADRQDVIQNRISQLAGLRKRFGRSIPEVLKLRENMEKEVRDLTDLDGSIESLKKEIEDRRLRFSQSCLRLSEQRKMAGGRLESIVPEILNDLGMPQSRFKVELEYQNDPKGDIFHDGHSYLATPNGMDFAGFLISVNKGHELRPLVKVASGGEISRIMLALKSIIAEKDRVPILVFDEIDSGVSGRIARTVGRKLSELAHHHQIICITHLPQIASLGERHFSVEKEERHGKTRTVVRRLIQDERAEEIAKLLAGEHVKETHLSSARELLDGKISE